MSTVGDVTAKNVVLGQIRGEAVFIFDLEDVATVIALHRKVGTNVVSTCGSRDIKEPRENDIWLLGAIGPRMVYSTNLDAARRACDRRMVTFAHTAPDCAEIMWNEQNWTLVSMPVTSTRAQWDEGLRTVRQFNDLLRVLPPVPGKAIAASPPPAAAARPAARSPPPAELPPARASDGRAAASPPRSAATVRADPSPAADPRRAARSAALPALSSRGMPRPVALITGPTSGHRRGFRPPLRHRRLRPGAGRPRRRTAASASPPNCTTRHGTNSRGARRRPGRRRRPRARSPSGWPPACECW